MTTRADLRDRFDMADEAFALSPIGARATQPGEADYEAIREAFMETARGRWFLGEYAKRNRNADTRMVLDAVARIEETLAAQRMPPELDNRLPEALAAIRSAVDEAANVAATAIDGLGIDDSLAPIRKGARIVKEISWRWREIGADSRICDLIDSQVSAIEASCGQISERDPRPTITGAFDLIRTRIDGFAESDADDSVANHETVPPGADEILPNAVAATAEPVAAAAAEVAATGNPEIAQPDPSRNAPVTSAVTAIEVATDFVGAADARDKPQTQDFLDETDLDEAVLDEAALGEVVLDDVVLGGPALDQSAKADMRAPGSGAAILHEAAAQAAVSAETVLDESELNENELTENDLDDNDLDEAVLDVVALAMAAPDPDGEMDYSGPDPDEMVEPALTPTMAIAMPEPAAPQMRAPVAQAAPSPEPQSIGSALLANGFLEQHRAPAHDPLAPIRRMSQAEKIAFFS
jgi:hypothetical protein